MQTGWVDLSRVRAVDVPWSSEGWQGEQAGRFLGDTGGGASDKLGEEGPLQCGPKVIKGRRSKVQQKHVAVTQSSPRRQELPVGGTQAALRKRGHVHGAKLNTLLP